MTTAYQPEDIAHRQSGILFVVKAGDVRTSRSPSGLDYYSHGVMRSSPLKSSVERYSV